MTDEMQSDAVAAPLKPIPTGLRPAGGLKPPVRAVVFDIYGTLFVSGSGDIGSAGPIAHMASGIEMLAKAFDISMTPEALNRALTESIRAVHVQKKADGIPHPEVDIVTVWQSVLGWKDDKRIREFATRYEMIVNPVYPMPGLASMLETVRNAGLAMGIISNAQFYTPGLFETFLGASLDRMGFLPDLTLFSFEAGQAKPSIGLFTRCVDALERLKIPPGQTVYVGNDMLNDIYPAFRTGFQTVLFAGDTRSLRLRKDRAECRNLRADAVITELSQLADMI